MKIHIKNMVCDRCVKVVKEVFETSGIQNFEIKLGQVEVAEDISEEQIKKIGHELETEGFELIENQAGKIVEQIKNFAVEYVYKNNHESHVKFSVLLAEHVGKDYNYLSNLFSSLEDNTIEHFLIDLKIERVKELLVYDEKTLSEIAWEMGYSSVVHLSGQFKRITGFSSSHFKQIKEQKCKLINDV